MKCFLCLFIFVFLWAPVCVAVTACEDYLKKGKIALEKSQYKEAVELLSGAVKGCPLLGDYAMFWLSEAYHDIGRYQDSLKIIRGLLNAYPDTPLIKQARIMELTDAFEVSEKNIEQLYESYILDYPEDSKIKYLYAKFLIQKGQTDRAKELFKDLYIKAGAYSNLAYSELRPEDISIQDILDRSANLIDRIQYKSAEESLRLALSKDDGKLKTEILKNLGLSLFKQKRYSEAAEVFGQAHDRYWEMRSLYRAGEKGAVNLAVNEMLENGDKRMASILISLAADKRREGKIKEALSLYQSIIEKYPSESEDALWGIAWTYYMTGEYEKASDVFKKLYDLYEDPQYFYWNARSVEAAGGDAKKMYFSLAENGHNFYGAMSYSKSQISTSRSDQGGKDKHLKNLIPLTGISSTQSKNERIQTLFDIGFSKEAIRELISLGKSPDSINDVLYICSKFNDLKLYKNSVRLAVTVPYSEEMHPYLYPLAYREIIEKLSKKYDINPFLVLSVIREESRYNPEARSPAGALGLMQLMPSTAKRFGPILKLDIKHSDDILDIEKNIHIGIFYLNQLMKEFGSYVYVIAAYNAGEAIVKRWIQNTKYKSVDEFVEDIPYIETKNYVKRVINTFFEYTLFSPGGDRDTGIPFEKL